MSSTELFPTKFTLEDAKRLLGTKELRDQKTNKLKALYLHTHYNFPLRLAAKACKVHHVSIYRAKIAVSEGRVPFKIGRNTALKEGQEEELIEIVETAQKSSNAIRKRDLVKKVCSTIYFNIEC